MTHTSWWSRGGISQELPLYPLSKGRAPSPDFQHNLWHVGIWRLDCKEKLPPGREGETGRRHNRKRGEAEIEWQKKKWLQQKKLVMQKKIYQTLDISLWEALINFKPASAEQNAVGVCLFIVSHHHSSRTSWECAVLLSFPTSSSSFFFFFT